MDMSSSTIKPNVTILVFTHILNNLFFNVLNKTKMNLFRNSFIAIRIILPFMVSSTTIARA